MEKVHVRVRHRSSLPQRPFGEMLTVRQLSTTRQLARYGVWKRITPGESPHFSGLLKSDPGLTPRREGACQRAIAGLLRITGLIPRVEAAREVGDVGETGRQELARRRDRSVSARAVDEDG